MLQLLEDDYSGTFADNKAISIPVERSTGFGGSVVKLGR
jgi:hypothetical protein